MKSLDFEDAVRVRIAGRHTQLKRHPRCMRARSEPPVTAFESGAGGRALYILHSEA